MSTPLPAVHESLARAAAALARGELVAFPTETVYGLGADARNEAAIAEVFRLKGRPPGHPLIVHLPSADALWRWADADAQAAGGIAPDRVEELAAALWPGPVTFVLRASSSVSRLITGGQDTVALRTPGHPTALALLAEFGGALVAPSANRFGRVSPTTAQHVLAEFPEDLLVIDAGPTEFGLESTILDLSTTRPRLLRPGAMPLERIEALLGASVGRSEPPETARSAALRPTGPDEPPVPRVPGSLARHYSPRARLRLLAAAELTPEIRGAGAASGGTVEGTGVVGVITRAAPGMPVAGADPSGASGHRIVLPADPVGFGAGLYAALRALDAAAVDEILVERPPAGDDWLAVRDRLTRAAAPEEATPVEAIPVEATPVETKVGLGSAGDLQGELPGGRPQVAILMGSTSDWETMRHADELLERFGVAHTCQVVSAHRTPAKMAAFAVGAAAAGYRVIIAGAGGAAHLPGMVAAQTHLPVLGVPVLSSALNGVDSLLSQVQMPRGVPVGTLAIGPAGAVNAALLAVAILALNDERLERELIAYRSRQTAAAEASTLPSAAYRP